MNRIGRPVSIIESEKLVESIIQWFLFSGIQNWDSKKEEIYGSFNAWYEQDKDRYPFVYSEITGYLITMMCYLWERTRNEIFIERAKSAAEWLLKSMQEPNGAIRCIYPLDKSQFDFKKDQIYAFDNGIVLNGFVNLYRVCEKEKYLTAAVRTAEWLVSHAQKPSGGFYPLYQMDEESFLESDNEWSTSSGSYHVKVSTGLLNLYDVTGKKRYLDSAIKACNYACSRQKKSGRFPSYSKFDGTNAHPLCYTAEGLWVAGTYLGVEGYLTFSAKGIKWLLDTQSHDGKIPRLYIDGKANYNERLDAMCQAVRMARIHIAEGRLPEAYQDKIDKIIPLILQYRANDGNVRAHGGICFGKSSGGQFIPHVNAWVTAFALQALEILTDDNLTKLTSNPFLLV